MEITRFYNGEAAENNELKKGSIGGEALRRAMNGVRYRNGFDNRSGDEKGRQEMSFPPRNSRSETLKADGRS